MHAANARWLELCWTTKTALAWRTTDSFRWLYTVAYWRRGSRRWESRLRWHRRTAVIGHAARLWRDSDTQTSAPTHTHTHTHTQQYWTTTNRRNYTRTDYWRQLQSVRCLSETLNSLARAVVKAPKYSHITPSIRSLHWIKITERIEYKLLSLTNNVLTTNQPSYVHNLITVQPSRSTRSSSLVTLTRPSISSSVRWSFLPVCFPSSLELTPGFSPSTTH